MRFNYKKIKPIRKSKGLTQGDIQEYLSNTLGKTYNRSTISAKETGRNPFNLQEIEALAEYFEVDVSAFFEGESLLLTKSQNNNNQGDQRSEAISMEVQSYLLKRIQELEAEVKELKANPQAGAAAPAKNRRIK
jgi:transcriptional regulator with XRE-family HTH domain